MRGLSAALIGLASASSANCTDTATRHTERYPFAEEEHALQSGILLCVGSIGQDKEVMRETNPLKAFVMLLLASHSAAAFTTSGQASHLTTGLANIITQRAAMSRVQPPQGNSDFSVVDVQEVAVKDKDLLSERIAQVVNWAYRGKDEVEDKNAWTGERHLLSGIRTNATDVAEMLRMGREFGPTRRALFVARSDELDGDDLSSFIGTVQVECSEDGSEAEIGLFSVDPDLQSKGIGGSLLRKAEEHAAHVMGARLAVLWVITVRSDLLEWYERTGYVKTGQMAPFPADANVGMPRQDMILEFVRLEKELSPA